MTMPFSSSISAKPNHKLLLSTKILVLRPPSTPLPFLLILNMFLRRHRRSHQVGSVLFLIFFLPLSTCFSSSSSPSSRSSMMTMKMKKGGGGGKKEIYNIPNSGWTNPQWNWGYGSGTGHDCAAICRRQWSTQQSRNGLVQSLLDAPTISSLQDREPQNIEEVKLILALAWQNGRWNGSDGGRGGYGDVLAYMAQAERYEQDDIEVSYRHLIKDMQQRYSKLNPTKEQLKMMNNLLLVEEEMDNNSEKEVMDIDASLRQCCGLVLDAMGFIENGL